MIHLPKFGFAVLTNYWFFKQSNFFKYSTRHSRISTFFLM